ncbi:MAG TPA: sugar transferase [Verrucomicrobiae bacterium]|nr:sugar transferase [Verrucomicrobiae bacterium]
MRKILYAVELALVSLNFFLVYYVLSHYSLDLFHSAQIVHGLRPLYLYYQVFWTVFLIWSVLLWTRDGYRHLRVQGWRIVFLNLLCDCVIFLGLFASLAFLLKFEFLSRFFILAYVGSSTMLLIFTRGLAVFMARRAREKGYNLKDIVVVGTGRRAQKFLSHLARHREWGYRVVGLIDREPMFTGENVAGYNVVGTLEDLPDLLEKKNVDEVFFITPRKWLEEISKYVAYCEAVGVPATVSTDLFDIEIARRIPKNLDGMTYLTFETRLLKEGELVIKRFFDVFLAATALAISAPILAIVALAIKLRSSGPVFFKQVRCGKNGKPFTLYKFRTMVVNAEDMLKDLKEKNEMSGPVFKMTKDPRITEVGSFLRKTSLDEFPQFWNVLKGDMSIVGPRPPLPTEVSQYEPWQRRRLSMKPGITCIWQVSGRNSIGFEEWMGLDLRYIDQWSIWMDMKILFQTVHAVIAGDGK